MRAHDQSSIFSTGRKFRPDYGLLFELHALTLVARSYALLVLPIRCINVDVHEKHTLSRRFYRLNYDMGLCTVERKNFNVKKNLWLRLTPKINITYVVRINEQACMQVHTPQGIRMSDRQLHPAIPGSPDTW